MEIKELKRGRMFIFIVTKVLDVGKGKGRVSIIGKGVTTFVKVWGTHLGGVQKYIFIYKNFVRN